MLFHRTQATKLRNREYTRNNSESIKNLRGNPQSTIEQIKCCDGPQKVNNKERNKNTIPSLEFHSKPLHFFQKLSDKKCSEN